MKTTTLPEYIKTQELEYQLKISNEEHILIRLDGKNFSKWTKQLKSREQPFNVEFADIMAFSARFLMEEMEADGAYTASDEVTLWFAPKKQHFLGGKVNKLTSLSASFLTAYFNSLSRTKWEDVDIAFFDSRTWAAQNIDDVKSTFTWRFRDCIKNSVSALAQSMFSKNQLYKKTTDDRLKMIRDQEKDWQDLPRIVKYGTFFAKTQVDRKFTTEEIEKLPAKHEARTNPDLVVSRKEIKEITYDKFIKHIENV